eukprot:m.18586 g.18586  ORF g.18586 m.18586 type:complete len:897 (+) comp27688_c0_seq2:58-2748(+)
MSSSDAERARELLEAVEQDQVTAATSMLDQGKVGVNSGDTEGITPLMVSSATGNEHMVRILLKRGASIDQRSLYGWTALMQASCYGNLPVVGLLLQNKANPNVRNVWGATALSCACRNGHVEIASLLLDDGTSVNDYGSEHADTASPIVVAAQHGHDVIVRMLLAKGADVEERVDEIEWSALMMGAANGRMAVCKAIVDSGGGGIDWKNACDLTALDVAIAQGHLTVERYLEKRTSVKPKRPAKMVHIDVFDSAKGGYVKRMREILGADQSHANLTDDDGATPLMFAAMRGYVEIAGLLLENGANINAQDTISGWTALMQAVYHDRTEMTRFLIGHDADVMIQGREGVTAFDMASIIGVSEVVRMLAAVTMKPTKKGGGSGGVGGGGGNRSPHHPNRVMRHKHLPAPKQHTTVLDSSDDGSMLRNADGKSPTRIQSWWSKMSSRFRKLKFGKSSTASGSSTGTTATTTLLETFSSRGSSASSGHRTPASRKGSVSTRGEQKSSDSLEKDAVVVTSDSDAEVSENPVRSRKSSKTQSIGSSSSMASQKNSRKKASLTRHVPMAPRLPQDVLAPIIPPFLPAPAFEFNSGGLEAGRAKGLPPHRHRGSSSSAGAGNNQTRGMLRPSKYHRSISASTTGESALLPPTPSSINGSSLFPPAGHHGGILTSRGNFSEPSNSGNSGAESSTLTVGSIGSSPTLPDSVFTSPTIGFPYRGSNLRSAAFKSLSSSNHSPGSSMSSTLVASSSSQQRAMRGGGGSGGRVPGSSVYSSDTESTLVASQHHHHLSRKKRHSSPSVRSMKEEDELTLLMRKLSLENYTPIFEEQEVDMEAFLTLSDGDLRELGISSMEPRRQILSAISGLKSEKRRERSQLNETMKSFGRVNALDPPQSQAFENGVGW